MRDHYSLILLGGSNTGKKTFVDDFNEIEHVAGVPKYRPTTNDDSKPLISGQLGRLTIFDEWAIYFIAIDNWNLFFERDMVNSLHRTQHCITIFLDSTAEKSIEEASQILVKVREIGAIPYAIIANKQDLPNVKSIDDLRSELKLVDGETSFPCVAIDPQSAKATLYAILKAFAPQDYFSNVKGFFEA